METKPTTDIDKKKATTTVPKKETPKKVVEAKPKVDKIKELEDKIAELTKLMESQAKASTKKVEDEDKYVFDDEIVVISQCIGELLLFTGGLEKGNRYSFANFGDIEDIPFGDLKDIVKNNKLSLKRGDFFIADEKAVAQLRLKREYSKLLSNEDISNLLNKDTSTVIEVYKTASKEQKETVISIIQDAKQKGKEIDANLLIQLGELSGKKLLEV